MLKVKILNPLATAPTIAHPGEDLGYDIYALRQQGQPINDDGTPSTYIPPAPGMPTRIMFDGKIVKPIRVEAGRPTLIDTGISAQFTGPGPVDGNQLRFGLLIRDRSSLAKKGLFVTAGVVDAGYRGEIKVMLNVIGGYIDIWPGDKIAQLIPIPVLADKVQVVTELEESERQEGGFGSSGQ